MERSELFRVDGKFLFAFVTILDIYPYKRLRARPYFRSAVALSVAPPPLPVNLAACEGLAGGSGKFREFSSFLFRNPWNFGNHPDLKIPGSFGITRIEV